MPAATPVSAPESERSAPSRILRQARAHFFEHGYCQCTMDDLATELGMSKKTLYQHFASKEELMRAVIDDLGREIRASADALLANRQLNFAEKLRGFAEGMVERTRRINPLLLRDLQRFAPALYRQVAEMREKNIPYVFGRFIEEGQLAGGQPRCGLGHAVEPELGVVDQHVHRQHPAGQQADGGVDPVAQRVPAGYIATLPLPSR